MQLVYDLATQKFYSGVGASPALKGLLWKRRDQFPVDVLFTRSGVRTSLPSGTTGSIGLKRAGDFTSSYSASSFSWTVSGSGDTSVYSFSLSLSTTEIDQLFEPLNSSLEPEHVAMMLELTWGIGSSVESTPILPVTLQNDVNRGDEGAPTEANLAYPAASDVLTKSGNLSGIVNPAAARTNLSVYSQSATDSAISAHSTRTDNPHATTKAQVGLGQVDNTSDSAKPVSMAQQTALNLKANIASPTFTGTVSGITAAMVGLGQVDNTADSAKPVSTPQAAALAGKANTSHAHAIADVTSLQTALDGKAPSTVIASANFTAVSGTRYITTQTLTITDPTGTAVGQNYEVMVGAGTATIGGIAYAPSRIEIIRYFNGTSWQTQNATITGSLTIGGYVTSQPSLFVQDVVSVALVSNALALPSNANVIYLTGTGPLTTITGGTIGATYTIQNKTGARLTVTHGTSTLVCQGAADITLGVDQSCQLVCENATKASVYGADTTAFYRTSNFTAVAGARYVTTGSLTVSDPATAANGDSYEVIVVGGTATIGGVAFASSRIEVVRWFNGLTWTTTPSVFSDNLTLSGTNNTAANQTAASDSSLMTRSLVADEGFFNLWNTFRPVPNPGTGSLRATATINSDGLFYQLNLPTPAATASSYGRVSLSRGCNGVHFVAGNGIRFNRRLGVMVRGTFAYQGSADATTISRLIIGGNGGVPATSDANALTDRGFGIEFGSNGGVQSIRAFAHNGTTYTTGPWISATAIQIQTYGILSDGAGNISLLYGTQGSRPSVAAGYPITGGPTAIGNGSLNYIDHVVVNSSAATTATTTFMLVQDAVILAT